MLEFDEFKILMDDIKATSKLNVDLFSELKTTKEKTNKCSIMASQNWHKNTNDAIKYCQAKGLKPDVILSCDYEDFLKRLGSNDKFIFLPKTPETLSRIVVEARMMGMTVIANNRIGATKEDWFKLKGEDLIEIMYKKRKEIPTIIMETFKK